jgi:hypothetical protein
MTSVLFVHGTGTRDPAYSQALEDVGAGLAGTADVQPCYWREKHRRLAAGEWRVDS